MKNVPLDNLYSNDIPELGVCVRLGELALFADKAPYFVFFFLWDIKHRLYYTTTDSCYLYDVRYRYYHFDRLRMF